MMSNHHRILAILFDLGDTIMLEETEVKDAELTTQRAHLVPGMADLLRSLKVQGHRLGLVADSRPLTPVNVLRQHGIQALFDTVVVSEVVGARKPDAVMFTTALASLGIPERSYGRVLMVGNNLERDVAGANRCGLISVWFHINDRRRTQPATLDETPLYTVTSAAELSTLIQQLDRPNTRWRKAPPRVLASRLRA
jgi:putative hydrolase of the HAD superfamily